MNGHYITIKVLLILSINYKRMLYKADCGLPAIPDSTKLSIFKSRYEEEIRISYECESKKSQLIEGKYRTCIHRRWNGSLPRCAIEVDSALLKGIYIKDSRKHHPIYKQIYARSLNKMFRYKVINDTNECERNKYLWNTWGNQTWTFQLTRGYSFNYFILYMKGGSLLENIKEKNLILSASIHDLVYSKSCELEQLSRLDDEITYKVGFICNSIQKSFALHEGIDESVQEIIINVKTRKINVTLIFCDLKVYTVSDSCGSPETPLNSQLLAQKKTYVVISCKEGYYIKGEHKVKCGPNGKWMDEFPLCIPNHTCNIPAIDREDPFLQIEYKQVYKYNGSLYGEPDSVALYSCINQTNNTFMQFEGETSRICKDGKWSGHQPTCHMINMTPSDQAFHIEPNSKTTQQIQSLSKLFIIIMAMLGSFTVGGISVAVVIFIILKRRQKRQSRPKISIFVDESEDIEYDKNDYSTVRVSQCSHFSNEVVNPLYEDIKKSNSPLNTEYEKVESTLS